MLMMALKGSLRDYRELPGTDLIARADAFFAWQDLRRQFDLWPYAKSTASAPRTTCLANTDSGKKLSGVNFASQDYLSLASHPSIKQVAIEAIEEYGVHSAGSAALLGNSRHSIKLEKTISTFLRGKEVVLYPTGWSAGFASVQGFVRPNDHVVMDVLAHSCLQEGARAATRNIHFHGHLNVDALQRRLRKIRASDKSNAILVVTESLFSMHSDTPDIRALREICKAYDALLLVDCAHDLGAIGEDGLGHLGLQNTLGDVDIVIGSFSKTFASNGGFVAVNTRAAAEYLKYYSATQTFSNALSPVQAATVQRAFEIVASDEGRGQPAPLQQRAHRDIAAGQQQQDADVERKVARLRPVVGPADAHAQAVGDHQPGQRHQHQRHGQFGPAHRGSAGVGGRFITHAACSWAWSG